MTSDIRAIDAHVHLATAEWLEESMGPYIPSVEEYFHSTMAPRTLEEMVETYRRHHVRGILLAWDAERHTGRQGVSNQRIADIVREYPDVFWGFGSVDPVRTDAVERVRALPALGLKGLKLHPTLQGFDPANPDFDEFFATAAELNLPLLVHVGTSGVGARKPGGQGLRIDVCQPIRLDAIAARHPELRILLAHVGWPWHLDAIAMALHKTNVYLDISGWRYKYLPPEVHREMKSRLQDQVLFGTDYPMFDLAQQLQDFDALELEETVSAKILRQNALTFLGL
ncbi:MAG: amidohydrolase family protein [Firmicutes bacterium]|jgi:predicted TIM-barrel fold metal-dependent hydrolase|nr:amidohydrolase family protein [Bacillota bacterium]